jgi:hypothetical protein
MFANPMPLVAALNRDRPETFGTWFELMALWWNHLQSVGIRSQIGASLPGLPMHVMTDARINR